MNRIRLRWLCSVIAVVAASAAPQAWAATVWTLDHATLTYTVHHPLKTASGASKEAKGRGRCEKGRCEFLIAAPVKSFDSGDSNRDLHMLEVTRGGANPMVVVRTSFDEASLDRKPVVLSFDVEFAGKKATYRDVKFDVVDRSATSARIKGRLEIKLSDFAIDPPSLLTMKIEDVVPVDIDTSWTQSAVP